MGQRDYTFLSIGRLRARVLSSQAGITLIELIVVLVILGLLATVVGPRVMERLRGSKREIATMQIRELEGALDLFALDLGRLPTTDEGLEALIQNPGLEGWNGPYLKSSKVPLDPWGKPYQYRSPGQHGDYDLFSFGPDGQEGGEGENADIVNWQ